MKDYAGCVETVNVLVRKMGNVAFSVLVILLLLAMVPMKVSGSNKANVTDERQYHELEARFLDVVDLKLREAGYTHCGITMNSVVNADKSRCYYVRIHHDRITLAGEEEWENILDELKEISFPVENCSIQYILI